MTQATRLSGASILALSMAIAIGAPVAALAADAAPENASKAKSGDVLGLDEIVVTASGRDRSKLHTSLSVTDVNAQQVVAMAPQSQAEVLRLIPGMLIDDSAGPGGNANFSVRGLPVVTGGSPFVQLQEDGLPTVLFGDMNFGNNDYWERLDVTERIESVRGGSASTLASQAPGAVINYISDTGTKAGGQIGLTEGLNYTESKVDFAVGGPIADGLRYHVDGFYKIGNGLRGISWNAEDGYQIKVNVTKDLPDDRGYVRLTFKRLDDKEPTYTSTPAIASVSGSSITGVSAFPGFDARNQSNLSTLDRTWSIVNQSGNLQQVSNDGIHPIATAFGGQLHYKINDQITLDDSGRVTSMSGTFATQFLTASSSAGVIGSTVNGATVGSIVYANGPNAGQVYTNPYLNTGPNIYAQMKDMGSVVNDLSLTGKYDVGGGHASLKAGVFYMNQDIAQVWAVNPDYSALSGSNPAQLDLYTGPNGTGQKLTVMGQAGYGNNWGNCCARAYDLQVADTAPYFDLSYDWNALHLDVGVRHDEVKVTGWAEGGVLTSPTVVDSGSLPTMIPDANHQEIENYTVGYTSWSVGALYDVTHDISVFARASEGYRANVDRNILSGYVNADGSLNQAGKAAATDKVDQEELGVKSRGDLFGGSYGLNATLFHAELNVNNFDLTNGEYFTLAIHSTGVEIESTYRLGGFGLNANMTYTDSTYAAYTQDPAAVGKAVSSTPSIVFVISPTYSWRRFDGGMVIQGQNESWANGDHSLRVPGQVFVDAFLKYRITDNLFASINANNLLDDFGVSARSDQSTAASIRALGVAGGYSGVMTTRPEPGRAITASISYAW